MTTPDYASWLTKQQAAEAIGVSTKTIEKLAADLKIEQARWKRPAGGPELAVYEPTDVARIALERRPARPAFVLPATPTLNGNGNGYHPEPTGDHALAVTGPSPAGADAVRVFLEALVSAVIARSSESSEKSAKLFLTIPEAAAMSGLPQADLRRALVSGELKGRRTGRGGWRIKRQDLEAL